MPLEDDRLIRRRRSGDNPLATLRSRLGDANLIGVYTRDGVRLDGIGNVACIDDARCSTKTGRLLVPRINGSYVNVSNQPSLNGLVKFSAVVRFTYQTLIGSNQQHLFGRATSGTSSADTTNFSLRISGSGNLFLQLWDTTGAILNTPTLVSPLVGGTDYYLSVVFDGTLASGARVRLGIAPVTNGVVGAFTFANGGGPTEIATTTTPLSIGAASDGTSTVAGPIDTIAFYIGTALTDGQITSVINGGFSTAHHLWTFDGNLIDSGTTGNWNGTVVGTGLAYCSDDTRWGCIIMGGGGSASPTWDAANREVVFDGVAQYLRATGGALGNIVDDCAVIFVGASPVSQTADEHIANLANGATTAVGLLQSTGPTPRAFDAATSIAGAYAAATRVFHARKSGGAALGFTLGGAAEAITSVVTAAVVPNTATVGASATLGQFADLRFRGLVIYAGDYSGQQVHVNNFAQRMLGANI